MKWFALILLFLPGIAKADAWDAITQPGAIAVMRHALAPGNGDPSNFALDDCTTQRNLDGQGRAQARAIGVAFRDRGVVFDAVLTSQWCRTRETAELLELGPVRDAPSLNSFFQDFSTRNRQTEETRALIAATEGRLMLVTHYVNIQALTGLQPRSGEVLIIRQTGDGIEVLDRLLIAP